jgi:hypothetical protein
MFIRTTLLAARGVSVLTLWLIHLDCLDANFVYSRCIVAHSTVAQMYGVIHEQTHSDDISNGMQIYVY